MKSINNARFPSPFAVIIAALFFTTIRLGAADAPVPAPKPAAPVATIRIVAGLEEPLTDEAGNKWLPAQGFADGDQMNRPDLVIENTKIPSVYRAERFGMSKFSYKLANGRYTVKLHFAITYEAINAAGQCVFSLDVEGHAIKDLDIWKKARGRQRAYVESVPVTISDGSLDIDFIYQGENPVISGIEIIPAT